MTSVLQVTKEDIDKAFGANVNAPLYMMQSTVPVMPRGGRIINIGSIASKMGVAIFPLYVASKAAQDALTYAMAMEVSRYPSTASVNQLRGFVNRRN